MSVSETMVLYNKLFTQEKRAVNRLLRALASGKVEKAELSKVCRLISKAAASQAPARKGSGYILYYKQHYEAERKKAPDASLGEIGRQWKALPLAKREQFKVAAKEAKTAGGLLRWTRFSKAAAAVEYQVWEQLTFAQFNKHVFNIKFLST